MLLYDSRSAPNPRRVRIFLAEKGLSPPVRQVDLATLEQRSEAFRSLNPTATTPVLVLDDGFALSETIAICRYFEALHPQPALFGESAKAQAIVEMWQRRIEFGLLQSVLTVFRHSHPAMAEMEKPQVREVAEAFRPKVFDCLAMMERQLENGPWICGDEFSVADITALVAIDFMRPARIALPENLERIRQWRALVGARKSAAA